MARPEDTFPGQEPEITSDARTWAVICHLAGFAAVTSIPFANILGPLVAWLIKRHDHPFIDENGKEALNFQISLVSYFVGAFVVFMFAGLAAVFMGDALSFSIATVALIVAIPLVIAAVIFAAIVMVIAAMRANEGKVYRYPLTIRFVR